MPKPLFQMWRYPRMVAWFIYAILLVLLVRLPFWLFKTDIIPYYLDFNPVVVLAPIMGVFLGAAGVLGCTAASLIGDGMYGMWSELSAFRATGIFFFALSAKRLWDAQAGWFPGGAKHAPDWNRALRFSLVAVPGCFIDAAWSALGSELHRFYPFSYYLSLKLSVNLLSVALLGVALYWIAAKEIVSHFGTWKEVMGASPPSRPVTHWGAVLLVVGSIGGCLVGLGFGGFFYGHWPTSTAYVLGTSSEPGVLKAVAPFLILHLVGLFWRGKPKKPKA